MANQVKKKFIGNDQIDGAKILLDNNQFFRIKKQDGSPANILKLDATDKLIISDAPHIVNVSTDSDSLQTKAQIDAAIDAESVIREAAEADLQSDIDSVEAGLAQEITDRTDADDLLQDNIDAEAAARIAADALLIPLTQRGVANGVATLDGAGKVPASQLPSYVDDVLEFADEASFPVTGETGKIYVALDDGRTYRWGGSAYAEISPSAVLSVNGQDGVVVLDTDDISEGSTNLYYTDARAQAANDARFDLVEADVATHETRLDALEADIPSWHKLKIVVTAPMITAGYADLAHVVVPNSLTANIDRLAIHEGAAEDFTLSTVGGVSRVTFLNDLVSPGQSSMDVGDNLFFKYQY